MRFGIGCRVAYSHFVRFFCHPPECTSGVFAWIVLQNQLKLQIWLVKCHCSVNTKQIWKSAQREQTQSTERIRKRKRNGKSKANVFLHRRCNKKIYFAALETLMYTTLPQEIHKREIKKKTQTNSAHTIRAISLAEFVQMMHTTYWYNFLFFSQSPSISIGTIKATTIVCKTYSIFWIKLQLSFFSRFLPLCTGGNLKLHICHRYLCMRCEFYAIVLRCQSNAMHWELPQS